MLFCARRLSSTRTFPLGLAQVIRNISMWSFRSQEGMENPEKEYRERTLWDPLVEPLLDLATETESHELLVEVRRKAFLLGKV